MLENRPNKLIKSKSPQSKDAETIFNDNLRIEAIGALLKSHVIELSEPGSVPKYWESSTIECLGESKRKTMQYVIEVVRDMGKSGSLLSEHFPQETQNLLKKLKEFVVGANECD